RSSTTFDHSSEPGGPELLAPWVAGQTGAGLDATDRDILSRNGDDAFPVQDNLSTAERRKEPVSNEYPANDRGAIVLANPEDASVVQGEMAGTPVNYAHAVDVVFGNR